MLRLLSDLSKDQRIKSVVEQLKNNYRSDSTEKINTFKELLFVIFRISAKFLGKKKKRVLEETLDAVGILIQISILLKTNVFERPEVRTFFQQLWKGVQVNWLAIYNTSKIFVDQQLSKMKRQPSPTSRQVF